MFHATKNRMAASAASGMCAAQGASSRMTSTRNNRVHDARQRAGGAIADVGGGARDGAGGGEAAEQRRDDVGRALADELLVRIVTRAGHAVGDHRGEQRFDGA